MKSALLSLSLVMALAFTGAPAYSQNAPDSAHAAKKADGKKKSGKKKAEKKAEAKDDGAAGEQDGQKTAKKADRKEKEDKSPLSAVAKGLKTVKYVTAKKADLKATHYIYLVSASWCGPCNQEMPHVVQQYKEMRQCGVELILVSADHDQGAAKGFVSKYGAEFPCAMGDTERGKLPGWKDGNSIPFANIVDAEGNSLASGRAGQVIGNWKQTCGK